MKFKKSILINNLRNVENYLGTDVSSDKSIHFINLDRNRNIDGIDKLLNLIPTELRPKRLKRFYKTTGLKIQVERIVNCDVQQIDRKGYYPRPFANIWDEEFVKNVDKHPEWLEPQEEPDIIIRIEINTEE